MPEDTAARPRRPRRGSTTALVDTTLGTANVSNQKDRLELVLGVMAIPVDSATTQCDQCALSPRNEAGR